MSVDTNNKIKLSDIKTSDDLPKEIRPDVSLDVLGEGDIIYEKFFDGFGDITVITPTNGFLVKVNEAFRTTLGYTDEEVLGKSALTFVHPDEVETTINAQKQVNTDKDLKYFENRWKRKDGTYVRLEWSSTKIGNVFFSTARVKNEVNTYLSKVSHELRTPLNSIIGFVDLLAMSTNLGEDEKQFVKCMSRDSTKLLALINDVIDLDKTNIKGFTICNVNIKTFIMDFIDARYNDIECDVSENKSITLIYKISHSNNVISVFRDELYNVFTIIISNAIKFNVDLGKIYISVGLNGKSITIHIKDTGIGISEDFMKRLYIPFEREYSSIIGTGLGLSMAKRKVELMGGLMNISSTKGEGTDVMLTFPIVGDIDKEFSNEIITKSHNIDKIHKVMYVEDNKTNVLIIKHYLKKIYGDKVIFRSEGLAEKALEVIKVDQPDVLILDYHLPDYNGDELYKKVLSLDISKNINNFMFISADVGQSKVDKMKDLGVDIYLSKPIYYEDFKKCITNLIPIVDDI